MDPDTKQDEEVPDPSIAATPELERELYEDKPPDDFQEKQAKEDLLNFTTELIEELIEKASKKSKETDLWADNVTDRDQLTAFIQDTLGALADDIEMGERTYVRHDEVYFWMTYFFLHFCGFRLFLANIDEYVSCNQNLSEVASTLVDLIDEVAQNAPYLNDESDVPEHVAKNILWQILNSRMLQRHYDTEDRNEWFIGDLLDNIIERLSQTIVTVEEPVTTEPVKKSEKKPTTKKRDLRKCQEYSGTYRVAEYFISSLLEESMERARRLGIIQEDLKADEIHGAPSESLRRFKTVPFPSIDSFSIKAGQMAICKLIDSWVLQEHWLHSDTFLMAQSDECSDYYFYEAKFSLPTQLYPVPQATAGIIFIVEVSRVKPSVCPVQIKYKLEGSGLVHIPGEYWFQESWLLNILESKLSLFKKLRF